MEIVHKEHFIAGIILILVAGAFNWHNFFWLVGIVLVLYALFANGRRAGEGDHNKTF
ncbi:MAG: hypothetical protein KJO77_00670 [Bacteroidia bacterium]|nr:hypothetical protein [Bacteroidia bacterium]NND51649.1 hypothetical protein [Flavobacteriaceae bacterium]